MSQFEVVMPKMGESITQATITKWFIKEGDRIEEDQVLLEIATDKVDSEIPSPVEGIVAKILFKEGDIVPVGTIIAIISLSAEATEVVAVEISASPENVSKSISQPENIKIESKKGRFYSPLVKTMAKEENISVSELDSIEGTGLNERVRKEDLLQYIKNRPNVKSTPPISAEISLKQDKTKFPVSINSAGDEIIEMDRMRRIIADHMVMSKHTAPHVTNFVEADVTNLVLWRNKVKPHVYACFY
jgi:2-oxoglutarate dehydrogenase E2 component (dihydrolipoamide succinyltransferase)